MKQIIGESYNEPENLVFTKNIIYVRKNIKKILKYDETLQDEVELYIYDETQYTPNEYYANSINDIYNQNILAQQDITNIELQLLETQLKINS